MIYADNAATTRISDGALKEMLPFLQAQYGNPSSQYSLGVQARHGIAQARRQIAAAIGAESSEIIFTSGGSEANNWVLQSVIHQNTPVHIITSTIEHSAVLNTCRMLEAHGAELTYLPVDANGRVNPADLKAALRPHTKLVSIMLANNELGTIQPIEEIGRFLKGTGILFHSDAVQAVGHIPVCVLDLGVDFLSISAHKFYGAKGTGALYKRNGVPLSPLIYGGEQEQALRAGTENTAGIVSAGCAITESVEIMDREAERLRAMVQETIDSIRSVIPTVRVNGGDSVRLPGTVNLGFDGVSGESLMHLLDLKGICVSTSSACTAGNGAPSHVLLALGQTESQAKSAIRISYGRYNTSEDVQPLVKAVCSAYRKIKDNQR